MKNTGVIYARYSSSRQREESIEGQVRICLDYAAEHAIEIVHVYKDRAKSARTADRPAFLQMIKDSAKKEFSCVLVYALDRFSRSRYDSAVYKHKLLENGVKVISASETIADDPTGIIMESLLVSMAEYYSAELSQKVLRGMTQNALEGKWPGGTVPFGYRLNPDTHHLEIDPVCGPMVPVVFDMYIHGHSLKEIQDYINSSGVRSFRGRPFSISMPWSMLRNETYTGVLCWRGEKVSGVVPPLVSKEIFDLASQQRKNRSHVRRESNYLLSGKVFCQLCGGALIGTSGTSQSGKRHYYYMCSNKKKNGCTLRNIRRDILERAVLYESLRILAQPETTDFIVEAVMNMAMQKTKGGSRLKQLEAEEKEVQKKLANCLKALENGVFAASLQQRITELEARQSALNSQIQQEKRCSDADLVSADAIRAFLHSLGDTDNKKADEQRKEFLSLFVRKIVANADRTVDIYFNLSSQLPGVPECSNKLPVVVLDSEVANAAKISVYPTFFTVSILLS